MKKKCRGHETRGDKQRVVSTVIQWHFLERMDCLGLRDSSLKIELICLASITIATNKSQKADRIVTRRYAGDSAITSGAVRNPGYICMRLWNLDLSSVSTPMTGPTLIVSNPQKLE